MRNKGRSRVSNSQEKCFNSRPQCRHCFTRAVIAFDKTRSTYFQYIWIKITVRITDEDVINNKTKSISSYWTLNSWLPITSMSNNSNELPPWQRIILCCKTLIFIKILFITPLNIHWHNQQPPDVSLLRRKHTLIRMKKLIWIKFRKKLWYISFWF